VRDFTPAGKGVMDQKWQSKPTVSKESPILQKKNMEQNTQQHKRMLGSFHFFLLKKRKEF
jgi:hypothetical protein